MNPDNDWYGHKRILADYCGLAAPRSIFGYVPHGWYFDVPNGTGERRFQSAPYLVWNTRHADQVSSRGVQNVRVIGAPFVYLYDMTFEGTPPVGAGTIVFPQHSADGTEAENHVKELAFNVAERFAPPYTVSIYYQDLGKPEVEMYRHLGWRIVSFGTRADPTFLYRQILELAAHANVVSNSPQTALWYGALLSRNVAIIEPRPSHATVSPLHNKSLVNSFLLEQFDRVNLAYPDLMQRGLHGAESFEAAAIELGYSERLSPDTLALVLGWRSRSKATSAQLIAWMNDFRLGRKVRLGNIH